MHGHRFLLETVKCAEQVKDVATVWEKLPSTAIQKDKLMVALKKADDSTILMTSKTEESKFPTQNDRASAPEAPKRWEESQRSPMSSLAPGEISADKQPHGIDAVSPIVEFASMRSEAMFARGDDEYRRMYNELQGECVSSIRD